MLTVANTLDVPEPSHWPISMKRFGSTPAGKPRFRVVWSPSVKKIIFGENSKGEVGAHLRPAYRHLGGVDKDDPRPGVWIIEKWISGMQATQMTPAQYEQFGSRDPQSGMLLEPYPHEGNYNHCWSFQGENPEIGSIEKIIGLIKEGEKRSFAEIKAANRAIDAKLEKEAEANRFLRVRETEPLNGIRPMSFRSGPKKANHKTMRNPKSANELGLPVKRGSVMSMKGKTVQWPSSIQA